MPGVAWAPPHHAIGRIQHSRPVGTPLPNAGAQLEQFQVSRRESQRRLDVFQRLVVLFQPIVCPGPMAYCQDEVGRESLSLIVLVDRGLESFRIPQQHRAEAADGDGVPRVEQQRGVEVGACRV
jgi:hypothetical protein